MADKRDECDCHRECTALAHECEHPCRWPNCLTDEEHERLAREIEADWGSGVVHRKERPDRAVAEQAGPDDGHQFHFAVAVQGSTAVVGEAHRDSDWIGEPIKLTVRAWSLPEACAKASAVPLNEWTFPDYETPGEC